MDMEFGRRIRALREEAGLSQKQLADKLFVSPAAVGNWEQNSRIPSGKSILKMADVFGEEKFFGTPIDLDLLEKIYRLMPDALVKSGKNPDPLEFALLGLWIYQNYRELFGGSDIGPGVSFAVKDSLKNKGKPDFERMPSTES